MRLVTWNACRGAFDRKVPLLDGLEADVAVVQEIAAPLAQTRHALWFGDNPKQGLAVLAREPYSLKKLQELPGVPKFVIPIAVEGPNPFVLFAVWTLGKRPLHYVRGLVTAVDMYAQLLAEHEVVFLGDFNSNAIWDPKDPPNLNHSALVDRLHGAGLVSAYHHHRREAQGRELEPTFYLQWNEEKPYHLDYCFLPRAWAETLRGVEVGSYEAWKDHSDHRPLMVDLDLEARHSAGSGSVRRRPRRSPSR